MKNDKLEFMVYGTMYTHLVLCSYSMYQQKKKKKKEKWNTHLRSYWKCIHKLT